MTIGEATGMFIVAATPGLVALLGQTVTTIKLHNDSVKSAQAAAKAKRIADRNAIRLDHLENGGGDVKIDTRLAIHNLIDRRGSATLPHATMPENPKLTALDNKQGVDNDHDAE